VVKREAGETIRAKENLFDRKLVLIVNLEFEIC